VTPRFCSGCDVVTRRKSWESIVLSFALLVLVGIAAFGVYRTATSDLPPPVWPSVEQSSHCWPAINWEGTEGISIGVGGMTADEAATAIDAGEILDLLRGSSSQGAPPLQVVNEYSIALRHGTLLSRALALGKVSLNSEPVCIRVQLTGHSAPRACHR
jgi:hypothetical protein